jgi:hypothetical protein
VRNIIHKDRLVVNKSKNKMVGGVFGVPPPSPRTSLNSGDTVEEDVTSADLQVRCFNINIDNNNKQAFVNLYHVVFDLNHVVFDKHPILVN